MRRDPIRIEANGSQAEVLKRLDRKQRRVWVRLLVGEGDLKGWAGAKGRHTSERSPCRHLKPPARLRRKEKARVHTET